MSVTLIVTGVPSYQRPSVCKDIRDTRVWGLRTLASRFFFVTSISPVTSSQSMEQTWGRLVLGRGCCCFKLQRYTYERNTAGFGFIAPLSAIGTHQPQRSRCCSAMSEQPSPSSYQTGVTEYRNTGYSGDRRCTCGVWGKSREERSGGYNGKRAHTEWSTTD